MKHYPLKLLLLLFLYGVGSLQAQEAVHASGGTVSDSTGSISFSVGQIFYASVSGTNESVNQGVQQVFQVSTVTGIEDPRFVDLDVSVYPNPTSEYLTLDIDDPGLMKLSYLMYDARGNLLEKEPIDGLKTSIITEHLVPAIYFLKVVEDFHSTSKEVKTFKIIKN